MDEKTRKILERPFPADIIKQRQGPNGKLFSYVEIQHYVDRLNEAFGGDWSLENMRREQIDDQVIVEVRLSANGVIKTGLGGTTVTRRRDNGRLVSLADDFKKAEADAIKRACRLLGVGANLYSSDAGLPDHDNEEARDSAPASPMPRLSQISQAPPPSRGPSVTSVPQGPRLSSRQLAAIMSISRRLGMDAHDLRSQVLHRFGVVPEHLSRSQASELIDRMGARANGGNGGHQGSGGNGARQPGEDG